MLPLCVVLVVCASLPKGVFVGLVGRYPTDSELQTSCSGPSLASTTAPPRPYPSQLPGTATHFREIFVISLGGITPAPMPNQVEITGILWTSESCKTKSS